MCLIDHVRYLTLPLPLPGQVQNSDSIPRVALHPAVAGLRFTRGYSLVPLRGEDADTERIVRSTGSASDFGFTPPTCRAR